MKRLLRIGRWMAVLVLVLIVVAAAAGYVVARRAWPQTAGTVAVHGIHGDVEIIRDSWGVPHLFAKDERDLFFAQGFVHAQDRLWQMHLGRAAARGELSKLFGEGTLETDRILRAVGSRRAAEKALEALDPDTRQAVEAYSDGVNAFLARAGGHWPVEFLALGVRPEPWTPADVMLVEENISLALSNNGAFESIRMGVANRLGDQAAQELVGPYPDSAPVILAPRAEPQAEIHGELLRPEERRIAAAFLAPLRMLGAGSNSWVVHGSRTASGRPLLANDTHLDLPLPSIWYENGLYAGRYAVTGFSFPGAPFVAIGHNRKVAWGIANLCADTEDLYLEKLDSADRPTRYQADGNWLPLEVSTETIEIKGRTPVEHRVLSTRHGPLVNGLFLGSKNLPPVALRWARREGGTLFNALAALDRAQSGGELRMALKSWPSPTLSFVYADVDGNIGYQAVGRVPIRAPGHSGRVPVPGWDSKSEWQGFVPYEEMPSLINPPAGFIVAANNKVAGDDFPHVIGTDFGDPFRTQRINDQLAANAHVTAEDMRALQADSFSLPAKAMVPYLLAVKPASDLERQALDLVKAWDFRFETGSAAAAIYYLWYWNLLEDTFSDELGPQMNDWRVVGMIQTASLIRMLGSDSRWFDDTRTPERETRDVLAARALTQAVTWLERHEGRDPQSWAWGRLHTMSFPHQPFGQAGLAPLEWIFNSHTVQASGEPLSVNATFIDPMHSLAEGREHPFAVASGPALRFIADLKELGRSSAATPVGQSGLLFHPHREDQVDLWQRVAQHPMLFDREQVGRDAKEVLMMVPTTSPEGAR